MFDLKHILHRLRELENEPKFVALVLTPDGLWSVSVEWEQKRLDCPKATTQKEAVELAVNAVLDPYYRNNR